MLHDEGWTFAEEQTKGLTEYEKIFGEFDFFGVNLPSLIKVSGGEDWWRWRNCIELGEYLGECAKRKEKATPQGYVNAFFLNEKGEYDCGLAKSKDFDDFIRQVKSLKIRV